VGTTVTCPSDTQCTTYTANGTSTCTVNQSTSVCNDSSNSTYNDTCNGSGTCVGTTVTCPTDTQCTTYTANGRSTCTLDQLTDPCDDADDDTYDDTCDGFGACEGTAVTCPTDTQCTTYAANGTNTCTVTQLTSACDDSNNATHDDTCDGSGTCVGTTTTCPTDTQCTTYAPNGTSTCTATQLTGSCNDGDACTTGDVCSAGSCVAGTTAVVCDDGNECTDDLTCVPATGCPTPTNSAAGTPCGSNGVCLLGACLTPVDGGTDAGIPDDSGAPAPGPSDAGTDAAVGQAGSPPIAGAGGQGGIPIFNLGGDAGLEPSPSDAAVAGKPGSFDDDGGLILSLDGGAGDAGLEGGCDCSLPGHPAPIPVKLWVLAGLISLAGARRLRSRRAA
jgi:hypothetical protein